MRNNHQLETSKMGKPNIKNQDQINNNIIKPKYNDNGNKIKINTLSFINERNTIYETPPNFNNKTIAFLKNKYDFS
jgi:hypothetical protein